MELLQRYIDIMEVRFQGRLEVVQAIAPETLDALVPNLILQPLVENALEHGVSRSAGRGRVEISSRRDGDRLVVVVRDNGPGVGETQRGGIGLSNTRARLEQHYRDNARVTVESAPEGGAVATIVVPFHREDRSLA
jgi:sensor histidine kinase YesM